MRPYTTTFFNETIQFVEAKAKLGSVLYTVLPYALAMVFVLAGVAIIFHALQEAPAKEKAEYSEEIASIVASSGKKTPSSKGDKKSQ